jgi:uncharacterized phage protein (TIGR02218 family)
MSYYFTTHDRPLVIGGESYSPQESVGITAIQKTGSLDVNNVELTGVQGTLTGNFVINGGLNGLGIQVLKGVNWRNLPATTDNHPTELKQVGIIGESSVEGETTWKIQVQSKIERLLNQAPIKVTSPLCSHRFCDSGCRLSFTDYTVTTTIQGVLSQTNFSLVGTTANYSFGTIKFVDGPNAGLTFGISEGSDGVIYLSEVPEGLVANGQTVIAFRGCTKTEDYCRNIYNNFTNFNGIPAGGNWMPGNERYQNPPITRG